MDSVTDLRREILDPLYDACVWDAGAKKWRPRDIETACELDEEYWKQVLGNDYPTGCALQSVTARFFEDEPDHNRSNKPRLDIVLSFADGRWVRYHPIASLIWSDEQLPSEAMQARYNRAAKLQKQADKERWCLFLLPW